MAGVRFWRGGLGKVRHNPVQVVYKCHTGGGLLNISLSRNISYVMSV